MDKEVREDFNAAVNMRDSPEETSEIFAKSSPRLSATDQNEQVGKNK